MHKALASALILIACALGTALFAGAALAWNPEPSEPGKAIFYPDEVQVEVEETLAPESLTGYGSGFMLVLPPGVKRESFFVSVGDVPAGGYFWLDAHEREAALAERREAPLPSGAFLPENEKSPERRALLEKAVALFEEEAGQEGALAATKARLELWQQSLACLPGRAGEDEGSGRPGAANQPGGKTRWYPEDLSALDTALARSIPGLHLEKDRQTRALKDTQLRLHRAGRELIDFDKKEGGEIVFLPQAVADKAAAPLRLRYGYALPASCSPSYRLSAQPDKQSLSIAQDVIVSQTSGFTWNAVDTFVSTLRRDRTISPGPVRPWRLSLVEKPRPVARMRESMEDVLSVPVQAAAPMGRDNEDYYMARQIVRQYGTAAGMQDESLEPGTYQEEHSTFRLWSLGKQSIRHNSLVRLSLATDSYSARYHYTLRPISNPKGFLTAEVAGRGSSVKSSFTSALSSSLPAAIELPPGPAQFFVDGIFIGQQPFSFNGDKGSISFGSDPQVTATVRDLQSSSGEQGLISKDQTLTWHWQITLKNTRTRPVEVWLEDPMPDSRDESVILSAESTPKPEQIVNAPDQGGAKIYRWKAVLKPGEPLVIDHRVKAAAPKSEDRVLDPGLRR